MATVKSMNTLLAEMKTFLKAYNRYLDTGDTSLAKDLLLTPYSVGGRIIMEQVGIVKDLHILSKLTGADLDDEATNYGLERSQGTFASATVVFYTSTLPVADIVIPAGTAVQTTGTSFLASVAFNVIANTTFTVASVSAYYSYDRARYEFPVDAICGVIGENGNIGAEMITVMAGAVSGISGVTNLVASSGGYGVEDDEDLRARIALAITGRDLNTVNGLRSYTRAQGFVDAYAVRVEDPDAERTEGIDIFVIDSYSTAVTETFTYYAAIGKYYFTNHPVKDVTSVVSVLGPVSSADYSVTIDNTTQVRRSALAADYIVVYVSAGIPDGTAFDVTYTYSQSIANFQNTLNQDANRILTSDPLVKRAYPLEFFANAALTLVANAAGPSTRQRVKNALIQYFGNYRMNNKVQESDLIIVMQQGYGDFPVNAVDAVVINSWYLKDEFGTVYTPVADTVLVGKTQYAVYGSAILV